MTGRLPIRLRVAAAFALTTAAALVGLGAFVHLRVAATSEQRADDLLVSQLDALADLSPPAAVEAAEALDGEVYAQILTRDGRPVASSQQLAGPLVDESTARAATTDPWRVEGDARLAAQGEAEAATVLLRASGDRVLVVGTSREDVLDPAQEVLAHLLVGGSLALLVASSVGYLVAGSALRPVERMRRRAATISASSSGERLPLPAAHDELERLGRTLNEMLDRLDDGLRRERRFVAEASHDLRTPLALLRTEIDLALARPRPPEELVTALESAREEVARLTRLSDELLGRAAGEHAGPGRRRSEVDLGELLREVRDRFEPMAAGRGLQVSCESRVVVLGDRSRLDRAVSNLVDNALRHGRGAVTLEAGVDGKDAWLRVRDEGTDLTGGAAATARAPGTAGGSGLGLSIVRAVAAEHHGRLVLQDQGAVATLSVPTNPPL